MDARGRGEAVGQVVVFTGDGKGKTSAAVGVVIRALGQGLRVYIVYFMAEEIEQARQALAAARKAVLSGRRYLGFTKGIMPNFEYFLSCGIPSKLKGERYKKTPVFR